MRTNISSLNASGIDIKPCAIVILNWNGKDFLSKYLPTLLSHSPKHLAEIYIIDNASTDSSVSYLRENFAWLSIIELNKNYGFAGGYARGLKSIHEKYICLINSDVEVTEGWLEIILNHFENNPNVAAIQPKVLDLKDKTKFEYAGGSGGFYDRFGYAVCRGRYFDEVELDQGQYDDVVDIFWASGCCIFLRNEIYRQVGGLDQDYFAHQEEIDLCWRIGNYGFQVQVVPSSVVYHYGGGTLPYGSYFKSYLNFRNSLFNLFKNLEWFQLLAVLPTRMALDYLAALHSVWKTKKLVTLKSIIHAHYSFLLSLPTLISKRSKILKKGYPSTTIRKYILLDYYLFNCRYFSDLLPKNDNCRL